MEIRTTGQTRPPIIIVYGPHKIGKSTFGAKMPKPIFVQIEDGLEGIETQALPMCKEWEDVIDQLRWLYSSKHDFKTFCIDSIDWLEKLIHARVMKDFGWTEINPENSFGRGYQKADMYWTLFYRAIAALNKDKAMIPVLIGHSKIEKVEDPEKPNYDHHTLDLHWRAAAYLCEGADVIAFATQSSVVNETKEEFGAKVRKVKTSGESIMKLGKSPAYEAGNRYGLPDELPLDATAFLQAFKAKKIQKAGDLSKIVEEKNEEAVRPKRKGSKKTKDAGKGESAQSAPELQTGQEVN